VQARGSTVVVEYFNDNVAIQRLNERSVVLERTKRNKEKENCNNNIPTMFNNENK